MFKIYSVKQAPKVDVATVVTTVFARADGRRAAECFVLFADEPDEAPVVRKIPADAKAHMQALVRDEAERTIRDHLSRSAGGPSAESVQRDLDWEELDKPGLTRLWIRGSAHGLVHVKKQTGERELKAYLDHLTSVPAACCGGGRPACR